MTKPPRRRSAPVTGLLACALALCASAAMAEAWTFGDFQITWPDGFVRSPRSDVAQFTNADGVGVTVDVLSHTPMDADQERQAVENWRAYGHTQLVIVAQRHGDIVLQPQEEKLASGVTLISLADQQQNAGQTSFGLFFLVIAPDGRIAQIVVEGPGSARARMATFRRQFDSARWSN